MITITLTGDEALDYIKLKSASAVASFPVGGSVTDSINPDMMLFTEQSNPEAAEIPPKQVFTMPSVATTIQPIIPPVEIPVLKVEDTPADNGHISTQHSMQDEMEGVKPKGVFPTKPDAKPSISETDRKAPFDWKPWEATILAIANDTRPTRRNIGNIMKSFPKGIITKTVLRNKLVREGLSVSKDGTLEWRTDGYDHKTRGFKFKGSK